jgi:REP-associated tyrosine transposase
VTDITAISYWQGSRFVSGHAFRRAVTTEKGSASAAAMSIPIRHSHPESVLASERTFFVTSSTWGRQRLLQSDRSAGLFIVVLYEYRAQSKYQLHEFVVMPDHFHVLLTVGAQMTVERAVQFIKGGFAFRAGRELGLRSPIWQKGFSEARVQDEESFTVRRTYIRNNPVAASLVQEPEKYVYSSAHDKFELDAPPQRLKPFSLVTPFGTAKAMP